MPCLPFSCQSSLDFFQGYIWKLVGLTSPPGENGHSVLWRYSSALLAHSDPCSHTTTAHTFVPGACMQSKVHSLLNSSCFLQSTSSVMIPSCTVILSLIVSSVRVCIAHKYISICGDTG